MSTLYLDTSALAKRYLSEIGSDWIEALANPAAGNVVVVCDLTAVEFFSLLARRYREGEIAPDNVAKLQNQFLADFERQYLSIALGEEVLKDARDMVSYLPFSGLRSLDALQLASAFQAKKVLDEDVIFVSADKKLLEIAQSYDLGFETDNPNDHPEG